MYYYLVSSTLINQHQKKPLDFQPHFPLLLPLFPPRNKKGAVDTKISCIFVPWKNIFERASKLPEWMLFLCLLFYHFPKTKSTTNLPIAQSSCNQIHFKSISKRKKLYYYMVSSTLINTDETLVIFINTSYFSISHLSIAPIIPKHPAKC